MKNLFTFALVLVLSTGVVVAQSQAVVNQDGSGQAATVSQSGVNASAVVTQLGSDNDVSVSQENGADGVVAEVTQAGENNSATVAQTHFGNQAGARVISKSCVWHD